MSGRCMIDALPPSIFFPKTGDIFLPFQKNTQRTPPQPHLEISRNSFVHGDATDQGPHRQAPLRLPLRRRQPSPVPPPPLRHLLPSSAAARRRSRLRPLPERTHCSGRCCFPVHYPAAGLGGGPPSPGAAAAVLRRWRRLGFVLTRVLLGCNSLVYWCFSSILCCFGSPGEAWIDCLHSCWYFCGSPFHAQWHKNASFLFLRTNASFLVTLEPGSHQSRFLMALFCHAGSRQSKSTCSSPYLSCL